MRFLNMSQVNVAVEFSEKNSSLISEKIQTLINLQILKRKL